MLVEYVRVCKKVLLIAYKRLRLFLAAAVSIAISTRFTFGVRTFYDLESYDLLQASEPYAKCYV